MGQAIRCDPHEWARLRDVVEGGPLNIKYETDNLASLENILAKRLANLKPVEVKYAENQAAHPNLIPPGKIQDRISQYKIGDAKVAEIDKIGTRHEKIYERWAAKGRKQTEAIVDLVTKQSQLVQDAEAAGLPVSSVEKQVDELQKEIDAAVLKRDKLRKSQTSVENRQSEKIAKLIGAESPIKFAARPADPGAASSSKGITAQLSAPSAETKAQIKQATKWLSRVVESGDGVFARKMEMKIGEAPGVRPHFITTDPKCRIISRWPRGNQPRSSLMNSGTPSTQG